MHQSAEAIAAFEHVDVPPFWTVIAELRARGITSHNGIARALSEQGIPTARGSSTWTAAGVARLLKTLEE
jgi:hypothetical protein